MSKYMIRCDIEGVTGVVSYDQAEPGKAEYEFGKRMFMSDLMALLDGLNETGADEIVVYDEHYFGRNIDIDQLPGNVSAICGKPPYLSDWSGGLDDSFDGVILLGFHSKFGTENGLLDHSYELDIRDLRINDRSVGEIGMEGAIAGDHNVPILMVTADSAGIKEAEELFPGICGVAVKQSISNTGGKCCSAETTAELIRKTAMGIVTNKPDVEPFNVGKDVTLEVELNKGEYLTEVQKQFAELMSDENTLVIQGKSATDVWAQYWQIKLRVQEAM